MSDMCLYVQVLPALGSQRDGYLLKELHKRWNNHKVMVRWLSRFFNYLDRCPHVPCLSIVLSDGCHGCQCRELYSDRWQKQSRWMTQKFPVAAGTTSRGIPCPR